MARPRSMYPVGHKQISIDLDLVNMAILDEIVRATGKSKSYIMNAVLEYYYTKEVDSSAPSNYYLLMEKVFPTIEQCIVKLGGVAP